MAIVSFYHAYSISVADFLCSVGDAVVWESTNDGHVVHCLPSDSSAAFGVDTPSETLSNFLGRPVSLLRKGPRLRFVVPTKHFPQLSANAAFHNGYPLLVATESSLADVQSSVKSTAISISAKSSNLTKTDRGNMFDADIWRDKEVAIERFRPNIVLSGIKLVSKCARCQV